MPLYEYRCSRCGQTFELLRRMSEADQELVCPRCRSEEIERLISAFARTTGGCGGAGGRFT